MTQCKNARQWCKVKSCLKWISQATVTQCKLKAFVSTTEVITIDYISTCFLIVYQNLQSDINIVGNWQAQAVKEFEKKETFLKLVTEWQHACEKL